MKTDPFSSLSKLTGLSEANRPIRLRLWNEQGAVNDLLLVKRVSGSEQVCGGIEYRLLCVAAQAGLELKQFMAMPVELQFVTDTGGMRSVCGLVAGAEEGESDGGLATYQLIVRDALSIMEMGSNSRIFNNMNEVQITELILAEWRRDNPVLARAFDFETWRLKSDYPQRAFTMQYNESDPAFLRRLWKRRGLAWFFQPGEAASPAAGAQHKLVLFDQVDSLLENAAGSVRYHRDDGTEQRDGITAWHAVRTLSPGGVTRQSWDYKHAAMSLSHHGTVADQGGQGKRFAASVDDGLIDVPHAGESGADYKALGLLRVAGHELAAKYFKAEGGARALRPGEWLTVSGHAEIDSHPVKERQFVITSLQVEAENNLPKALSERVNRLFALNGWHTDHADSDAGAALAQASAERGGKYTNQFTCVRRGVPIVPRYDPRLDLPRMQSISVVVVGPVGEAVHCDELGRVRVRFPGCRPQEREGVNPAEGVTAYDSAWVQVSTSWAGARWGMITLPRVGMVCKVSFMGGDPDKPVITGVLHGGTTPPPSFSHVSRLPGDRYLSGIVSQEIGGTRSNQLRIDDTQNQIGIQLASDHSASQLNLGYLTAPRRDGVATARGDGFELRTDESGAIRTAKALLISAWKRLDGAGKQLSNEEHLALMQDCLELFKSLGQYAAEHHGLPLDAAPQAALKDDVGGAGHTDPQGQASPATISLTAPAGIALTTPKTIVSYAGANIDTVAQYNLQLTSGQRFNLNAGKGISLFAHKDGIAQIAHYGTFLMQSQHDDMQIDSAKDLKLTSGTRLLAVGNDEITLMTSGGAYLKLKGGNIELGGPGSFTVKTNGHHWDGPASVSAELPTFGQGDLGRTPKLLRATDGAPVEGMTMQVDPAGGGALTGKTDGAGKGIEITADHLQKIKASFFDPLA
ncbi:MAG: type VI secretion system Vgr family protein [Pseudomonadota bacterium]